MNIKYILRAGKHRMPPTRSKGFTLIELIVVICIIALLAGVLLQRVWLYQEQAEKAAMEQVAGALQSALIMQYGKMLTTGTESWAGTLATENPLNWLMKKPANYSGEYFAMSPAAIAPGNWAFDLKTRELIYVPYHAEYFRPGPDGYKWVRYHVRLDYELLPGAVNKNAKVPTSLLFEAVEQYQWF